MNVKFSNGKYCHEKCRQTKKCCLCVDILTISELKKARSFSNGLWLCEKCKICNGCFVFFDKEDLKNRSNLRRQGSNYWHAKCFKCTVSVHI